MTRHYSTGNEICHIYGSYNLSNNSNILRRSRTQASTYYEGATQPGRLLGPQQPQRPYLLHSELLPLLQLPIAQAPHGSRHRNR